MRHVASKISSVQSGDTQASAAPSTNGASKDKEGEEPDGEEPPPPVSGSTEEEKLEQLYEQIAWPLGRQYGHPYDAFKLALTCV